MPREGHATDVRLVCAASSAISIHVPREGHDLKHAAEFHNNQISIHVPREGHDEFCVLVY